MTALRDRAPGGKAVKGSCWSFAGVNLHKISPFLKLILSQRRCKPPELLDAFSNVMAGKHEQLQAEQAATR